MQREISHRGTVIGFQVSSPQFKRSQRKLFQHKTLVLD